MASIFRVVLYAALSLIPESHVSPASRARSLWQDDRVEFRIKEARSADSLRVFEAEYLGDSTVARFAIAFRPIPKSSGELSFLKVAVLSRPNSNSRDLLRALARIHDSSARSTKPGRLQRLDITAAVLGQSLSHGPGKDVLAGEFTSQPAGDWIVLKLFLDTPDGATTDKLGEPAELFLALNPVAGRGWFLTKDPEYWPELNRVLATVL